MVAAGKLDPEELRETVSSVLSTCGGIVARYGGRVEKFTGDVAMAVFGVPSAHEDDPVRATRAAMDIHEFVDGFVSATQQSAGKSPSARTGINTGLVLAGAAGSTNGTEDVLGDTVNVASRLMELAGSGDILVSQETSERTERQFDFEPLGAVGVKGKTEPIRAFKVTSFRDTPSAVRRLSGLRAGLVGREKELGILKEALRRLMDGQGGVISICGEAGTGKSRLVQELRERLDPKEVQWYEVHCYGYADNVPYAPLIDLLSGVWQISEDDAPDVVLAKIKTAVIDLLGDAKEVVSRLAGLFGVETSPGRSPDPQDWRARLVQDIRSTVDAVGNERPMVICIDDLHWADPSSIDLLRAVFSTAQRHSLLLCVYRPPLSLFTSRELDQVTDSYEEIHLHDLSSSESREMIQSLLGTDEVPPELVRFVEETAEGNPFYLEEVVNSLIESGRLVHNDDRWRLAGPIDDFDVPLRVNGVISARIDRLSLRMKSILQEASVIGRVFTYEILEKVTESREGLDECLGELAALDLIRVRSTKPDLEYGFKHSLTHDVVYGGMLKENRRRIHERIGRTIEEGFEDRLSEYFEAMAFHFKQGRSTRKAVLYLVKSGEKSLARYSLDEANEYFKEAFELLTDRDDADAADASRLIDLVIAWTQVFYYRGDFKGQGRLLEAHLQLAESLGDTCKTAMYFRHLGECYYHRERFWDSYDYLNQALALAEEIGDKKLIGYVCTSHAWVCAELGLLDEALSYAERAREMAALMASDQFLEYISLGAQGYVHWARGERWKTYDVGRKLMAFGQRQSNTRSVVMGQFMIGCSYFVDGDFQTASDYFLEAIRRSTDPYFSQFPRLLLGVCRISDGRTLEAAEPLAEVARFSKMYGTEVLGSMAMGCLGVVAMAAGDLGRGIRMVEKARDDWTDQDCLGRVVRAEYMLGRIYLSIVERSAPLDVRTILRNTRFLILRVPRARKWAETHLGRSVELAEKIGARGVLGQAQLDLGRLYALTGRKGKALEHLSSAAECFEQCGADTYRRQARELAGSLK